MQIGVPQAIMLAFMVGQIILETAKQGEDYPRKCSGGAAFFNQAIMFGLLFWGGFFHA